MLKILVDLRFRFKLYRHKCRYCGYFLEAVDKFIGKMNSYFSHKDLYGCMEIHNRLNRNGDSVEKHNSLFITAHFIRLELCYYELFTFIFICNICIFRLVTQKVFDNDRK